MLQILFRLSNPVWKGTVYQFYKIWYKALLHHQESELFLNSNSKWGRNLEKKSTWIHDQIQSELRFLVYDPSKAYVLMDFAGWRGKEIW